MIVCLTGGIGSGKTTVANLFRKLGVPVYVSDIEARVLMETSNQIKKEIIEEFGNGSYINTTPDRKYLASVVFKNKEKLQKLNAIIHPRVAQHFKDWYKKQDAKYVIKESAVLFENGIHGDCEKIILVTAPKEERIKRVISRDKVSRSDVLLRMKNQWADREKKKLSDFTIRNTSIDKTLIQVNKIHHLLLKTVK